MSSIANMAQTLTTSPWVAPKAPKQDKPASKTEIMRQYLRTRGWANSHTLALEADVPQLSLVGALLKNDIASGKVLRERDGGPE